MSLAAWFQRLVNLCVLSTAGTIFFIEQPHNALKSVSEIHPAAFFGVPRVFEKIYENIHCEIGRRRLPVRLLIGAALSVGERTSRYRQGQQRIPLTLAILFAFVDQLVLSKFRRLFGTKLEYAVVGSAATPRHILDFFHALGLPLLEAYGVSENVLAIAINRVKDFRLGSVGRPLSGQDVRISAEGEILVRGPGVCVSIADDSRITCEGYYRTGDNGFIDTDGFLFLAGRQSSIIKTSTGRKIVPEKIEALLSSCPGVEHVVVVGDGRKYLVALVTLSEKRAIEAGRSEAQIAEVFRRLQSGGAEWETVQKVIVVPGSFTVEGGELTSNMKLRRRFIEERYSREIADAYEQGVDSAVRRT
jgi:long-chain acyl-CoA synthetase